MGEDQERHLQELKTLLHLEAAHRSKNIRARTEVTDADREEALRWLHEVCLEQCWPVEAFATAVSLADTFLANCHGVKKNQLQLLAVVCLRLASAKLNCPISEETLLAYTDQAVLPKEVRAWEMLVLSKLDWNLTTVTICDYLESLLGLLIKEDDARQAVISNCQLAACLSLRTVSFSRSHLLCCRAVCALILTAFPCQSRMIFSSDVFQQVLESLQLTRTDVEDCLSQMEALLWHHLSPPSPTRTPSSQPSSPFKVLSSSTPKSTREPLREKSGSTDNLGRSKRALKLSINEQEDETNDKENNDSAIGLMNVTAERSPSTTTTTSSKNSSPDSGASSASPKSVRSEELAELDRLLRTTKISPLAKSPR